TVFGVVAGSRGAGCAAGAGVAAGPGRSARAVPAHSLLQEALPLLLFPRLHGQERTGGEPLPRCAGARMGAVRPAPGDRGTATQFRLLRRWHAVVSIDEAAAEPGAAADGGHALDRRGGNHVPVRAR